MIAPTRRLVIAVGAVGLLLLPAAVNGQGFGLPSPPSPNVTLELPSLIVDPGSTFPVQVAGSPGMVTIAVYRLDDPSVATDWTRMAGLGPLSLVTVRTAQIPSSGWSADERISVDATEGGIYYITASGGGSTQTGFVQATNLTFLLKTGAENELLWAVHRTDGSPAPGVVIYRNGSRLGSTNASGVLGLAKDDLAQRLVAIAPDGSVALGSLSDPYGSFSTDGTHMLLWFDRPIYRPGQTISYKALALRANGTRMLPYSPTAIRVELRWDQDGQTVLYTRDLVPDANGAVYGSFAVPTDARLGDYTATALSTDGARDSTYIQIESYEKPRVSVALAAEASNIVRGTPEALRASATWVFGAPLSRGIVHWTIARTTPYDPWPGCEICRYESLWSSARATPNWGEGVVASGDGNLSSDGSFLFAYTPGDMTRQTYLATVAVTAENGEQETATTTFVVHPSGYDLVLSTDRGLYVANQSILPRAVVRDLNGTPVAGVPVTFTIAPDSARGGPIHFLNATTNAGGVAQGALLGVPAGPYEIIAAAEDAAGNTASAMSWIWVTQNGVSSWDRGVALIPDKTSYAPGEIANVALLVSGNRTVLFTAEGRNVECATVIEVHGSETIEVPITADMAPGVQFVATAASPAGDEFPSMASFPSQSLPITVTPDERGLQISITTDKPRYRNGEPVDILVMTKDKLGRPVSASLSLGIVDASLYELAPEPWPGLEEAAYPIAYDVQSTASDASIPPYGAYEWQFGDASLSAFVTDDRVANMPVFASMGSAVPSAAPAASPVHAAFGAPPAGGPPPTPVRQTFPDTALWMPVVQTGPDGIARVSLVAPDTLTTWRVTARGYTSDGLFGDANRTFETRKPLMVELAAPPFFVQTDITQATAIVWNEMGTMRTINIEIVPHGRAVIGGPTNRTIVLSDGDSARVPFPLSFNATSDRGNASADAWTANLTVYAWSIGNVSRGETNESDAFRIVLPVLPQAVVDHAEWAGEGDANLTITPPNGVYEADPILSVTLTGSLGGTALAALPYLIGYPYGCVEQTMSRFLPDVVAMQALKEDGYNVSDPDVPLYVQSGLDRLARFQHADGGWGWWETDETNPYMTAYVVAGLSEAKEAGAPVPDGLDQNGIRALQNIYASETDPNLAAYEAYALALAGQSPRVRSNAPQLGNDGLALLGLADATAGDTKDAQAIADMLWARGIHEGSSTSWNGSANLPVRHMIRSNVQATAYALRLYGLLGRWNETESIAEALSNLRVGGAWATTKDTSEAILSFVAISAHDRASASGPQWANVTVNGAARSILVGGFASGGIPGAHLVGNDTQEFSISPNGSTTVQIRGEPGVPLFWSAMLTSSRTVPWIDAESNGIDVSKEIVDGEGRPATTLAFNQDYTVIVTLRTPLERDYVLVEDPLPAGAQVVAGSLPSGWADSWTWAEARDDHVAAFATTLPAGTTTLTYQVRAFLPGVFRVLPTTAMATYSPQIEGRSAESSVSVEPLPTALLSNAIITNGTLDATLMLGPETPAAEVGPSNVTLVGAAGNLLVPLAPPIVDPHPNGSVDIRVHLAPTELTAPLTIAVALTARTALFPLDPTGTPVTFGGGFAPADAAAWDSGPVMTPGVLPESASAPNGTTFASPAMGGGPLPIGGGLDHGVRPAIDTPGFPPIDVMGAMVAATAVVAFVRGRAR
ncbi:MAG: alpha-2-macroglobulin family protein [Thermoplasmatota archaeon]